MLPFRSTKDFGGGSTNTGGTVVPEMHGCSYKSFMNGKPTHARGLKVVAPGTETFFDTDSERNDIEAYNKSFPSHELALDVYVIVPTEKNKIERYSSWLSLLIRIKRNIHFFKACDLARGNQHGPENCQQASSGIGDFKNRREKAEQLSEDKFRKQNHHKLMSLVGTLRCGLKIHCKSPNGVTGASPVVLDPPYPDYPLAEYVRNCVNHLNSNFKKRVLLILPNPLTMGSTRAPLFKKKDGFDEKCYRTTAD
ncbi:hypothetical protein Tco_0499843 [Tanacetum coccineum]